LVGRIGITWADIPEEAVALVAAVIDACSLYGASWYLDEAPLSLRTQRWCGPETVASVSALNDGIRLGFDPSGTLNAGRFGSGG